MPNNSQSIDTAQSYGIGPAPIAGRESHTSDLQIFDEKLQELRSLQRSSGDDPYHERFWEYIRASLKECQEPIGFEDTGDPRSVTPKGPEDVAELVKRIMALGHLNPIYPRKLADASEVSLAEVLTELLYATIVGITQMRWAPECERCGSAVLVADSLEELPERAHCQGCQQPNELKSLDQIMVTFSLSSEILYILANNYACVPSEHSMTANACFVPMPATNSGSGFQYSFGCGEQPLGEALPQGKYRMHCPVSMTDNYLLIERDADEEDIPLEVPYQISEMVVSHHAEPRKVLTIPHGKLKFNLFPDTRSFFVLWVQEDRDEHELLYLPPAERAAYTNATEVIHHPSFKLFEGQVVPSGRALEIKHVALVFTDIVGSTELYAHLGDGEALTLVQRYFEVLFKSFVTRGRIVKTIGDAVMASFSSTEVAIEAVAEALSELSQRCFNPLTQRPLEMRVGIHGGSTVAVSLNGINDYFGQTVNIAARVQSAAGGSECFISEAMLSHERARAALDHVIAQEGFNAIPERELSLKGVREPLKVSGFSLDRS